MNDFLARIVEAKRADLRSRGGRGYLVEVKSRIADARPVRDFRGAIEKASPPALVAEMKKASPSRGVLREKFDPADLARIYTEAGASALSVLTEEQFFMGSLDHLRLAGSASGLPILRKDFILHEAQIYESRAFGADAVLLIATLLEPSQARDLAALAAELGMESVVEVHSEKELERVLDFARVIGINNRDLATFTVDLAVTFRVIREVPEDRIVISESGMGSRADVERVAAAGADAVLVGEHFMGADDVRRAVLELVGRVQ